MKIAESLQNKINNIVDYYDKVVNTTYNIKKTNIHDYWVVFDKNQNPFWIEFCGAHCGSGYNTRLMLHIYSEDRSYDDFRFPEEIGVCKFRIIRDISANNEIYAWGEVLIIRNEQYQNLGLGSQLFDIMEYISYSMGSKTVKAEICCAGNKSLEYLAEFYTKKDFEIDYSQYIKDMDLCPLLYKEINTENMKNFKSNLIKIQKDKITYNVIIPRECTKEEIDDLQNNM
ncbi:MAG: hypothetical protein WCX32_01405 [Clostridia bacterium]|jgi:hypothetical protein|nr:hypothetical protein [Clostridia bacterium]MDD4276048.1 hypothetical protein [Clostridia bacterium]